MITINGFDDLEQFGFNCLTGESCAYSMRLLIDVNECGASIWREFIGLPYDCVLSENWNSQVNSQPAIGSILITRAMVPDLIKYILFQVKSCKVVYQDPKNDYLFYGDTGSDKDKEMGALLADKYDFNVYRNYSMPAGESGRNTHQISGRVS